MSFPRRVQAAELWAGCRELCRSLAGDSGTITCPWWGDRSLNSHEVKGGRLRIPTQLQLSVSPTAVKIRKLHGACDSPCLPICTSLDSKSIRFDLVYSTYKHVAFFQLCSLAAIMFCTLLQSKPFPVAINLVEA